jgi:hypothetical protein
MNYVEDKELTCNCELEIAYQTTSLAAFIEPTPSHQQSTRRHCTNTKRTNTTGLGCVLTLTPNDCFSGNLVRESIVPRVDNVYSSLPRDVNEHYIYRSAQ